VSLHPSYDDQSGAGFAASPDGRLFYNGLLIGTITIDAPEYPPMKGASTGRPCRRLRFVAKGVNVLDGAGTDDPERKYQHQHDDVLSTSIASTMYDVVNEAEYAAMLDASEVPA
jgi:hypothetical protein